MTEYNIESHIDHSPNNTLCVSLQEHYANHSLPTKVLAASLTTVKEIMALAGIDHITLPPPLLEQLADSPASNEQSSLFDRKPGKEAPFSFSSIESREKFEHALEMSKGGDNKRKLDQVGTFKTK